MTVKEASLQLTFYTRWSEHLCKSHLSFIRQRRAGWCAVLLFGAMPFALFNLGYWTKVDFSKREYLPLCITVYIASLWILLSPILIIRWEQRFREFAAQIARLADTNSFLTWKRVAESWPRIGWICAVTFAATCVVLHELARPYLAVVMPVPEFSVVYFSTLIVLTMTGYATGIGIAGVVHTIRMYRALVGVDLPWEPFHQDERGGYSFLTDFALGTAATFVGGVTVVPAALADGAFIGGIGQITIFVLVVGYGLLTAAIFFWPMTIVFRKAQKKKQETLGRLSPTLDGAVDAILEAGPKKATSSVTLAKMRAGIADIDKVLMLYEKIALVKITPFSLGSVVQIAAYSALPIVIAGMQLLVSIYAEMHK